MSEQHRLKGAPAVIVSGPIFVGGELRVSHTVMKRLIRERILPATHVVEGAPRVIERKDLALSVVQEQVSAVPSAEDFRGLLLANSNSL